MLNTNPVPSIKVQIRSRGWRCWSLHWGFWTVTLLFLQM